LEGVVIDVEDVAVEDDDDDDVDYEDVDVDDDEVEVYRVEEVLPKEE
jgi:hypothetical protein